MAQDDAIDVARFVDEQKIGAFHVKLLILSFFLVGRALDEALNPRLNSVKI